MGGIYRSNVTARSRVTGMNSSTPNPMNRIDRGIQMRQAKIAMSIL